MILSVSDFLPSNLSVLFPLEMLQRRSLKHYLSNFSCYVREVKEFSPPPLQRVLADLSYIRGFVSIDFSER